MPLLLLFVVVFAAFVGCNASALVPSVPSATIPSSSAPDSADACTFHNASGNSNGDGLISTNEFTPFAATRNRLVCQSLHALWHVTMGTGNGIEGQQETQQREMRNAVVEELHVQCANDGKDNIGNGPTLNATAVGPLTALIEQLRSEFSALKYVSVQNCASAVASKFAAMQRLESLQFSGAGLTHIGWQQIGSDQLRLLDLRQSDGLRCGECANAWMQQTTTDTQRHWPIHSLFPTLPEHVLLNGRLRNCTFAQCPPESATIVEMPSPGQLHLGAALELKCRFRSNNPMPNDDGTSFLSSTIFVWPLNEQQQGENAIVVGDTNETASTASSSMRLLPMENAALLHIPALRSEHLGPVACRCPHCARPAFDMLQLRFPVPLSVYIPPEPMASERHIIVHGYPLDGRETLRLRITRVRDNRTEVRDLFENGRTTPAEADGTLEKNALIDHQLADGDQQQQQHPRAQLFFNGTLAIRPEPGHAQYFLRYFTLAVHECSQCAHAQNGELFRFEVCMPAAGSSNGTAMAMIGTTTNGTSAKWECATPVEHHMETPTHPVSKRKDFLPPPNNDHSTLAASFLHVLIALPLMILSLALLAFGAKAAWRLRQRIAIREKLKRKSCRRISRNTQRTEETTIPLDTMSRSLSLSTYAQSQQYHVPLIDARELQLNERIGKGAFGEVFVAVWRQQSIVPMPTAAEEAEADCKQPMLNGDCATKMPTQSEQKVAIKMLTNVQMDAEMDREAALLARLEHPNVLRMFGLTNCSGQVALVLELMNLGDLRNYLRNREPRCNNYAQFPPALLPTELINICIQICDGLCYLAKQQIVHRDLAARNCLISGETDMRCCSAAFRPPISVKISDFGMSRRLYASAEYYRMQDKRTALPVRWMPPECLNSGKFTPQSDIWSFGVLLFEVFSFGAMPFAALSNGEVLTAVMGGMRPEVPDKCPPELADLMRECWHRAAHKRISATAAMQRLQQIQNGKNASAVADDAIAGSNNITNADATTPASTSTTITMIGT